MDLDLDDIIDYVIEVAPSCLTLAEVGRKVNDDLEHIEWSDDTWRGKWKAFPEYRIQIQRLLGGDYYTGQPRNGIVTLEGNWHGAIVSDIHSPFHDAEAIKLAAAVIKWWNPNILIYNGDDLDCYLLSVFDKNPSRALNLQGEIDLWHQEATAPLNRAAGSNCRKIKLLGNHEHRFRKVLWKNPGLYGLRALEWPALLGLPERGMDFVEMSVRFNKTLEVTHGERVNKWSGMSAKAESEKRRYSISTATGHVHRSGRFDTWTINGHIQAQEIPCLMDLSPEYMTEPDWVQGLTLFDVKDGHLYLESIKFNDDYSCFAGKDWLYL